MNLMLDYREYEALFNSGDDEALLERFFDDDVRFMGVSRECRGRKELRAFLDWAHDGVREVMRPQHVLQQDDALFAEVDMDFHASKARADFPFGPLHPGDLLTVKFFVLYLLKGGRVVELKSMTWPPGKGVTQLPRLGAHPSQLAAFRAYTAAFSNGDFERFPRFYTEDVRLELRSVPPIEGRQGIVDFYRPMFQRVRERVTIHSLAATDECIELDGLSRFTAIQDAPDFLVGPLQKGDYIEGRVLVSYQLREGLISHISVRRGGEMRTFKASRTAQLS
jgi:ketosteroid isomerase-like protein